MEVFYKKDIEDKLQDAIRDKKKPIEYIKLTKQEAVELCNVLQKRNEIYISSWNYFSMQSLIEKQCSLIHDYKYHGVTLKVSGF